MTANADDIRAHIRRLERHDWRLWGIAIFIMIMMFTTVAALSNEVEGTGVEFFSRLQLEVAVRGLLTMVLLFAVYVVYQQIVIARLRRLMLDQIPGAIGEEQLKIKN